ncbi:hypothetical protein RJ639_041467 [Escallonia herrerae]|uniref:Uncharacterized protein n=1 Tax=Escallonia herrerae TaxID=1293975 RepID=A0AA88WFB9_9ASTE|nr:hypothetical protein RJ639_041467 [Escallonia herrerae]
MLVPRLDPVLQTERKVLWKLPQLPQFPPHLHHELLEVVDPGQELVLDRVGEEVRVLVEERDADRGLQEVEGGAEAGVDGGGEEARAAVEGAAEVTAVEAGLAEEEGEDGEEGDGGGGEEVGAHGGGAADVVRGEAGVAVEGGDGGPDGGGGGGEDWGIAVGAQFDELWKEAERTKALGRKRAPFSSDELSTSTSFGVQSESSPTSKAFVMSPTSIVPSFTTSSSLTW